MDPIDPARTRTSCAEPPEEVTAFVRGFASARGRSLTALAATLRSSGLPATARYLRRLPTVDVALSDRPAGREIRAALGRRTAGIPTGRLGQAVLSLTGDVDDYLAGGHKRALRRNLGYATRLGVTAGRVRDETDYLRGVEKVLLRRGMDERAIADLAAEHRVTEGWTYLAESADGDPLAFASWTVDDCSAMLRVQMSAWSGKDSCLARYTLHLALLRDLHAAGVTTLLADSALTIDPGQRYYQSLLGFDIVNLRLSSLPTAAADPHVPPARPVAVSALGVAPLGSPALAA